MIEQNSDGSGAILSDFFSKNDLVLIENAVSQIERGTSGEIRVVLRMNFDKEFAGDLDGQALHDFAGHGLANTKDKTGVLILLVLGARKFKILADKGIYEKVEKWYFEEVAVTLSILFGMSRFADGVVEAVADIGRKLSFYFPRKSDDTNELPDKPIIKDGE